MKTERATEQKEQKRTPPSLASDVDTMDAPLLSSVPSLQSMGHQGAKPLPSNAWPIVQRMVLQSQTTHGNRATQRELAHFSPHPIQRRPNDPNEEQNQSFAPEYEPIESFLPELEPNECLAPEPEPDLSSVSGTSSLTSSGPELSTGEVPESRAINGLPAFRYNAPEISIANAHIETPTASIDIGLLLRGSLTVSFDLPAPGVSTDIDQLAFRVEAARAVNGVMSGIRINGLNTRTPSIGATVGTEFSQTEVRFTPPNTMSFIGMLRVNTSGDTSVGLVNVLGQLGYELRVTVTPHPIMPPGVPVEEPVRVPVQDEEGFFEENSEALAVGAILLIIAAVALAPETGGTSLVPILAL